MLKHLLESADLVSDSANADGTWKVRLISEGRGSSGTYSAALLEDYHTAFDNVLSFEVHPEKGPEHRTFKQIVGRVVGETWIEKDENGHVGIYGNYLPDEDLRPKLERYKDRLGLSIFIEGDGKEGANGEFLVESFNGEDPYRSVDVVIAAGRGGRFEESLRKIYTDRVAEDAAGSQPGAEASAQDITKEQHMTPEQFTELQETLKAAIVESMKTIAEAKVEKDEHEITLEEAVAAYAEQVKAIDEADLLPTQAESLKAKAAKGEDIADALEEAKKIRDEARAAVQTVESFNQPRGRVLGESQTSFAGPTAWGHR